MTIKKIKTQAYKDQKTGNLGLEKIHSISTSGLFGKLCSSYF